MNTVYKTFEELISAASGYLRELGRKRINPAVSMGMEPFP